MEMFVLSTSDYSFKHNLSAIKQKTIARASQLRAY